MSEMYAGAVLFNDLYTSMHVLNSIRAATASQCKSISALVTCSRGRRSQTRRAAAFKTRCSGARVDCGNPESVKELFIIPSCKKDIALRFCRRDLVMLV